MPRSTREIAYSDFNIDDARVDDADPLTILLAVESMPKEARLQLSLEEIASLCRGETADEF